MNNRRATRIDSIVMQKLPRDFYAQETALVAQSLLGMLLVHRVEGELRIGRIVETEAYLGPHDRAAHSSKGITGRTRILFGPPGFAYVYLIYGIHHCMNVVTEPEGNGSAVLIRALEPLRGISGGTRGPGLLCKAMAIDRSHNGLDLCGNELYIAAPDSPQRISIVKRPRIGVGYAGEWAHKLLRFYIEGNPFISRI
jgi:DNA-3-methyladenine glycosylase